MSAGPLALLLYLDDLGHFQSFLRLTHHVWIAQSICPDAGELDLFLLVRRSSLYILIVMLGPLGIKTAFRSSDVSAVKTTL